MLADRAAEVYLVCYIILNTFMVLLLPAILLYVAWLMDDRWGLLLGSLAWVWIFMVMIPWYKNIYRAWRAYRRRSDVRSR